MKRTKVIQLAVKAGLFSDTERGMQGCNAAARVAILEHRLYANGRQVTHTDTVLPCGTHRLKLVQHKFVEGCIEVYHKERNITV